jgi:hypothetical protein
MVRVSAGVDDLMQMQRRVADLHQQHRQAQACEKHIGSPAIECVSPRIVQPVLRLPARSHEHLEFACCGQGRHLSSLWQLRRITLLMGWARASTDNSIDHPRTILAVCLQVNSFFSPRDALLSDAAFRPAQRLVARHLVRRTAKPLVSMSSEGGDVGPRSMLLCRRNTPGTRWA